MVTAARRYLFGGLGNLPLAVLVAGVAGCKEPALSKQVPVTDGDRNSDATEISWPVIDPARFLTPVDLATTCGVRSDALVIKLLRLPDEQQSDALGRFHPIYIGEVARSAPPDSKHFMGIVVVARDTAEHAAQGHELAARTSEHTPVAGTDVFIERLARNGWVRREVYGRRGRILYNAYETDHDNEITVCDDAELETLARLIENRLPRVVKMEHEAHFD